MKTLIKGGTLISEGMRRKADIIVEDDRIKEILDEGIARDRNSFDAIVDATGCIVMPGVIDSHVHFREPGLEHKADMESESRAAAFGGVTSVFDMPNTNPQTTTAEALEDKEHIAAERMHVNYAFFPGATNDNAEWLRSLDTRKVPGIKLFMGSSTGNMLVDGEQSLHEVFTIAHDKGLPIMAHCEDTAIINANMRRYKDENGTDDPDVCLHPQIRSEEACVKSSTLAIALARQHDTRLHIAHVSTAKELELCGNSTTIATPSPTKDSTSSNYSGELPAISLEATVAHLLFSQEDYPTLGARIKCNPAIKSIADRDALRTALALPSGGITTIGTDHAPHTIQDKQGGAAKAMSGMPMIQFSLVSMLSLVDQGVLTIERLVELMCHNPARLFGVESRGFIRPGYKADITIVRRDTTPWAVTAECIQSKCGWSPVEGRDFNWRVFKTICNGRVILDNGTLHCPAQGEPLTFQKRG